MCFWSLKFHASLCCPYEVKRVQRSNPSLCTQQAIAKQNSERHLYFFVRDGQRDHFCLFLQFLFQKFLTNDVENYIACFYLFSFFFRNLSSDLIFTVHMWQKSTQQREKEALKLLELFVSSHLFLYFSNFNHFREEMVIKCDDYNCKSEIQVAINWNFPYMLYKYQIHKLFHLKSHFFKGFY